MSIRNFFPWLRSAPRTRLVPNVSAEPIRPKGDTRQPCKILIQATGCTHFFVQVELEDGYRITLPQNEWDLVNGDTLRLNGFRCETKSVQA